MKQVLLDMLKRIETDIVKALPEVFTNVYLAKNNGEWGEVECSYKEHVVIIRYSICRSFGIRTGYDEQHKEPIEIYPYMYFPSPKEVVYRAVYLLVTGGQADVRDDTEIQKGGIPNV